MTNTLLSRHLSEAELDDVLIGCASDEAARHAAMCEACGAQIQPFQSSMTTFNEGTMAWAQAKSNTVSRDLSSARLSTAGWQSLRWSMGVATTAALACVMALGLHGSPAGMDAAQAPVEQTATSSSAQEIAADNEMLQAINSEMNTAAPAPLQAYRPASARVQDSRLNPANEVRD
jgi:hypothetical protein